ncbi:MAG: hypothetical protein VZS44_01015 [Bacilli bacterium]|nr:hypothetical protein [Bacilli bacterium]
MKKWMILGLLVLLTTLYLYFYSLLSLDAVWNYGFAYNISRGLIPYKDYNMIVTPLFSYILSLLILLFGNKFVLYYIFMSVIIVALSYLSYLKIGYRAVYIYMLAVITSNIGYNVLVLLLFIILINYIDNDEKNDLLIAFIIGLMILTKQTLGILIIPSIIFSKKRKKTIAIYFIFLFSFVLYLVINNNMFEFLDYCFFGMFDFTNGNGSKLSILTFVELFICIFLFIKILKMKFKDDKLIYILLFQIICFPIVDGVHFLITFIPILLYLFEKYKFKYKYFEMCIYLFIISFFATFNFTQIDFSLNNLYQEKNSFMYGKRLPNYFSDYFKYVSSYIEKYDDYRIYILEARAYVTKLELNMAINKYDLINRGNMGYKGSDKYIKEIDEYCKNNKCLFFVDYASYQKKANQVSDEIILYVSRNYNSVVNPGFDNIYIN